MSSFTIHIYSLILLFITTPLVHGIDQHSLKSQHETRLQYEVSHNGDTTFVKSEEASSESKPYGKLIRNHRDESTLNVDSGSESDMNTIVPPSSTTALLQHQKLKLNALIDELHAERLQHGITTPSKEHQLLELKQRLESRSFPGYDAVANAASGIAGAIKSLGSGIADAVGRKMYDCQGNCKSSNTSFICGTYLKDDFSCAFEKKCGHIETEGSGDYIWVEGYRKPEEIITVMSSSFIQNATSISNATRNVTSNTSSISSKTELELFES